MSTQESTLGLGVVGLGRAFMLMLPTLQRDQRYKLVAATTPSSAALEKFSREFSAATYPNVAELCADPAVDVVYIASPHQFHAEHVQQAAQAGKHILVEKPLAISLEEGKAMVQAAADAGVQLIVGPSHSFDAPILLARRLIESGEFGRVRMIQAMNYTDFLYRPRRPEELNTRLGGGVVFSQAVHQIDVVRLLGGGMLDSIRALTGNWDPERPTEGAYSALLKFTDGAFATLTYSGYGRFDSDEFMGWIGELGYAKQADDYGKARSQRRSINSVEDEIQLKRARGYENAESDTALPLPQAHEHFGPLIISCETADLRPLPGGVMIYGAGERRFEAVPVGDIPRVTVMDEIYRAVVDNEPPPHSGAWGLASLEACIAMLHSAGHRGDEVTLTMQVPYQQHE